MCVNVCQTVEHYTSSIVIGVGVKTVRLYPALTVRVRVRVRVIVMDMHM